jgi:hypothetical protein
MQMIKPSVLANWEITPVVKIALMNVVECWDQHSNDSAADRELHAMSYAQNAADTTIEEGMDESAWADASSATIGLLKRIGFCK